jgi:alkanesulfonate monooxygenase SsuD/methylene tetrahydromethanopterin reductase-like flavin-dependent oxidoreductase (luciferase family)
MKVAALAGRTTGGLDPLALSAFLGERLGPSPLTLALRGLELGVRNPIELAEQLATIDHAWNGRLLVGLAIADGLPAGRFEEALGLLRAMWSVDRLSGVGPHYVFGEIRPTLRPAQPGGPPLSLRAATREEAELAARLGLGLDVGGSANGLVAAYRAAGGSGAVSAELPDGVDVVDVRLDLPGEDLPAVLARAAALGVA